MMADGSEQFALLSVLNILCSGYNPGKKGQNGTELPRNSY
jgi:hypothetical protein